MNKLSIFLLNVNELLLLLFFILFTFNFIFSNIIILFELLALFLFISFILLSKTFLNKFEILFILGITFILLNDILTGYIESLDD